MCVYRFNYKCCTSGNPFVVWTVYLRFRLLINSMYHFTGKSKFKTPISPANQNNANSSDRYKARDESLNNGDKNVVKSMKLRESIFHLRIYLSSYILMFNRLSNLNFSYTSYQIIDKSKNLTDSFSSLNTNKNLCKTNRL